MVRIYTATITAEMVYSKPNSNWAIPDFVGDTMSIYRRFSPTRAKCSIAIRLNVTKPKPTRVSLLDVLPKTHHGWCSLKRHDAIIIAQLMKRHFIEAAPVKIIASA
jgi:hypothetical protein